VLSSMSSGVNHMSHVETQFPYALLSAGLSFLGFILASLLLSAGATAAWLPVLVMTVVAGAAYYVLGHSRHGRLDA